MQRNIEKEVSKILPREPIVCPWCEKVVNLKHGTIPRHGKQSDPCIGSKVWFGPVSEKERAAAKEKR